MLQEQRVKVINRKAIHNRSIMRYELVNISDINVQLKFEEDDYYNAYKDHGETLALLKMGFKQRKSNLAEYIKQEIIAGRWDFKRSTIAGLDKIIVNK